MRQPGIGAFDAEGRASAQTEEACVAGGLVVKRVKDQRSWPCRQGPGSHCLVGQRSSLGASEGLYTGVMQAPLAGSFAENTL